MSTLTANETMQAWLGQVKEKAEIRDANGQLLGYFTPQTETEEEMYERVKKLFDLEELERIKSTPQKGYTIDEVLQHLKSLENQG